MSKSSTRSQLARDFGVFLQPGFLVTLVLLAALSLMVGGSILWANVKYGISPF